MISRQIPHQLENDNYRRLANYIADANHQGEKALMSWCSGCWAGDDEYQLAIHEVEAVQAMNTRSGMERTYHLVISFRPEDEAKLTPDIFKEIEMEFAKAIGFEGHQRHCGVHQNTANIHLHIAYNQIHPVRLTKHEPYRDFWRRDKLCRQLEKRYGLTIDNGRDPDQKAAGNDKAKSYEARTGQESIFSYAQRHKEAILNSLSTAQAWADCHMAFYKFGLAITPHGNGLVIRDLDGKHSIKASDLDRGLSKGKLEKRFGRFEAQAVHFSPASTPEFAYTAQPVQHDAERDDLYALFRQEITERRSEMARLGEREQCLYQTFRQDWNEKWEGIKKLPMLKHDRQKVRSEFDQKKKAELVDLRAKMKREKGKIRERYPFTCWSQFLQHQAGQGNETALDVLRSRKTKVESKSTPQKVISHSQNSLASVTQMRTILTEMDASFRQSLKYHIDGKGTIIFSLTDGGTIRDSGAEIHFSAHSEKAAHLAAKLGELRWGQGTSLEGNSISKEAIEPSLIPQEENPNPAKGLGR
jgi:Relaxase/Mobilisation nuclease domain.